MTGATVTTGLRVALTGGIDFAFPPITWIWIAGIVLVSTVGAMVLFFMGLQRTGPTNAAILSTFEPVVTAGLAAALLGEQLTPVQLAGAGLVLAAAVVLQLRRRPAPVVPDVAIVPEVMHSAHEPVATHR
jgi:drug/metabolite transporter (DMT)-like permease